MLDKLKTAVDGYKTYLISGIGLAVALAGHFWGPFNLGTFTVPLFSWNQVWDIAWTGGLFSALHAKKTP